MRAFRLICAFAVIAGTEGLFLAPAGAAPSDATRQQLDALLTNLKGSTVRVYDIHDSNGLEMDTIKIIPNPSGGYIAVYHTLVNSVFLTSLSTSTDLVHWTYRCQLGTYASQPNIYACSNGGYLMVWEQTNTSGSANHIHFAYYASLSTLLSGTAAQSYDAPMTLSRYAEGTPNVYSVTMTNGNIGTSSIDTGGHYNQNSTRLDRQQRGTLTNFSSWTTAARTDYDNAILYWGVKGNIGSRDFLTYGGYQFNVMEGEGAANDFSTWKIYNFDFQTGNADQLSLQTDGGSTSFGNPKWTYLTGPDGNPCLVCSVFIFSQGAANGEAGPLLYYTTLPNPPTITNGPPPATAQFGVPYSFTYTYSGYPVPTFSMGSGALPPGLTLTSTGTISGTPTQGGSYSGTVQANNGTVATQNFTIQVAETYADWSNYYFPGAASTTGAQTATPQNDGVANVLKFALAINPTEILTATDLAALPVAGLDTTTDPGTTYLTLTYRQNAAATGVTYNVQVSSDLQNWSTVTPDKTKTISSDPSGNPLIEAEVNSQGAPREFIRLNVTAQ